MSRLRSLVLLGLLAGTACAHVDPERELLHSLRFEGNESLASGRLEERLALVESPLWPWAERQYFDAGTLIGDKRRLLRFYQAEGFYQTQVRSEVTRRNGEVNALFVVQEGPQTRIRKLGIEGLEALSEKERRSILAEPLPLQEGARIREEVYDRSRAALEQRLRDAGYADAGVVGSVSVDTAAHHADVLLQATPGPRLRFGRVVIAGSVQVPRATILASLRDVIPEGAAFSDERMNEAQRALFDLGVFGGVRVTRGPTNAAEETVPLLVAVREAPFQTLRAGGGAGLDKQRVEGRAIAAYTHRNFFGGLRTLHFENRLGYAYVGERVLQLEPTEAGVVGSSAVDFVQPELLHRVDGNLRFEYEHGLDAAYRFDSVKGRIGFPIRPHRSLTFTPSYNLQFFALRPFTESAAGSGEFACVDERGDCVLSFLEERLAWDRRDNPVETTSGWLAALSLQQGGGFLQGRAQFQRVLGELRYFQPLPGKLVLALKVEGGLILPSEGEVSPIMARFYAGGGNGMRAFGSRRLAPQKLRSGRTLGAGGQVSEDGRVHPLRSGDTVSVGGDALLDSTVELRIPLAGDLGMAVFLDAGNVSHTLAASNLETPNVAVGLGIRYKTPFGPIRLDAGYRVITVLPRLVAPDETLTVYSVPETPFALHFSIGEAF